MTTIHEQDELHDAGADASYSTARARSARLQAMIDDPAAPGRDRLRVLTGDRPTARCTSAICSRR